MLIRHANHGKYRGVLISDMGQVQADYKKFFRLLGAPSQNAARDCEILKQRAKQQNTKLSPLFGINSKRKGK
jgi:hypothetical protein